MKFTVVGDSHTKNENLEKQAVVFDLVERLGHPVVLLGDIFHTKEVIRGKALNFVFDRLRQSRLTFYILVGNHDQFSLGSGEHSLELLKQLPNAVVIDKPWNFQTPDHDIGFFPYIHDQQEFRNALSDPDMGRLRVLFMHQGVTGFDYGNGHIAENEIAPEELSHIPLVVSGHFHKYQHSGNLLYVGTPFSHDFGETDQDKYVAILETETLEIELIPTQLPQHRTLTVDLDEGIPELPEASADPVRVILLGSSEAIKAFDKNAHPTFKFIERPRSEAAQLDVVAETDSNPKKFLSWARSIKNLDEETIALGIELLESVED